MTPKEKALLAATVLDNPYCKQKPTPRQAEFLVRSELEGLYGGAAAGGKSSSLLMAGLQYVEVEGYAGLILRRTYADLALPGAIMDRCFEWLHDTDAKWSEKDKTWNFPAGSSLTFGYLESENDKYRYQSSEFQFCVAKGTPVLMADGSYKSIETLVAGEKVKTLEGPRSIIKIWPSRIAECVKATTYNSNGGKLGEQIHPIDHEFLTPGGWISYASIYNHFGISQSTLSHSAHKSISRIGPKCPSVAQSSLFPLLSTQQNGRVQLQQDYLSHGVCGASSTYHQNDCEGSDGSLPRVPPLPELCVPVVLHAPLSHLSLLHSSGYVLPDGQNAKEVASGSRSHCSAYSHRYDEQSRCPLTIALNDLPLQGDAEEHTPFYCRQGDPAHTPKHNQIYSIEYVHPYKREYRNSSEAVRYGSCILAPIGEKVVYDITVEEVHHYITLSHLVNKNCGFDELTQFSDTQYSYLFSRLRRLKGHNVPIRMRSASNPGGLGHEWVKARFFTAEPIPDRVFVGAKLDDNPHIDREAYEEALSKLDYVTREQLRNGDWNITTSGGIFFEPKTIGPKEIDLDKCEVYGACDPSEGGADFAAIGTLLKLPDGRVLVWKCDLSVDNQSKTIGKIIDLHTIFKYRNFWIESNSLGHAKGADGMSLFEQDLRRRMMAAKVTVPFTFIWNTRNKEDRIRALEPHYSNGTLLFRSDHMSEYPILMSQFKAFKPGSKAHDDGPDMIELAVANILNLPRTVTKLFVTGATKTPAWK